MIKKICFGLLLAVVTSSCVSSQLFEDLKKENEALRAENDELNARLDNMETGTDKYKVRTLEKEVERLKAENSRLTMDLQAVQNNYDRLKDSYDALEANSSTTLSDNLKLNRKLLTDLEAKERELAEESARLERLKKDLADRSARVDELEGIIAAKDAKMRQLKDAISAALTSFEGNGLTIEQRDGKVYVSMENKLLFESGSWAVNTRGREAVVALGNVLAENREIAVLIEGHTDNVPYGGNGPLKNNWDLSTKRATAIVDILVQNSGIPKENLTAAGRGEHAPVATNSTSEGRSKNRRIEVILTPKLDEITKLLNEI